MHMIPSAGGILLRKEKFDMVRICVDLYFYIYIKKKSKNYCCD